MITVALLVRLQAKAGKEKELKISFVQLCLLLNKNQIRLPGLKAIG